MLRNVGENGRERTRSQRSMIGDRDVMLTPILGRQPHVAASLPRYFVTKIFQEFRGIPPAQIAG